MAFTWPLVLFWYLTLLMYSQWYAQLMHTRVGPCFCVALIESRNCVEYHCTNVPEVSKEKWEQKKKVKEMIIYASVVCSMLGVRVLWLVQIEVPWSYLLPHPCMFLFLFFTFYSSREGMAFLALLFSFLLCVCMWHCDFVQLAWCAARLFEAKWVQGRQLHYTLLELFCWLTHDVVH